MSDDWAPGVFVRRLDNGQFELKLVDISAETMDTLRKEAFLTQHLRDSLESAYKRCLEAERVDVVRYDLVAAIAGGLKEIFPIIDWDPLLETVRVNVDLALKRVFP